MCAANCGPRWLRSALSSYAKTQGSMSELGQQHPYTGRPPDVCTPSLSRHPSRPGRRPAHHQMQAFAELTTAEVDWTSAGKDALLTVWSSHAIQTIIKRASQFAGLWVVRAPASGRRPDGDTPMARTPNTKIKSSTARVAEDVSPPVVPRRSTLAYSTDGACERQDNVGRAKKPSGSVRRGPSDVLGLASWPHPSAVDGGWHPGAASQAAARASTKLCIDGGMIPRGGKISGEREQLFDGLRRQTGWRWR